MARLNWIDWDTRRRWIDPDGSLFLFGGWTFDGVQYRHQFTQVWHDPNLLEERERVIRNRLLEDNM